MVLDVHPLMEPLVRNTDIPLVICEGTKQTLAAVSALLGAGDRAVVGMPGCYGWSQHRKQIPDLRELATVLRGRKVTLIFDADWKTNREVWQAAEGLTELLKLHSASEVSYVTVPGGKTSGLDDALAETVDPIQAMRGLLNSATTTLGRRPAKSKGSTFFDEDGSLLADKATDAVLEEYPAALAADGSTAFYQDGRYLLDRYGRRILQALGRMLGDKYRPQHEQTVQDMVLGRLLDEDRYLPTHPLSPWLNVRNGMLDLDTLELHEHSPDFMSVVQLPVDWDPAATCPVYEAWLVDCRVGDQIAGTGADRGADAGPDPGADQDAVPLRAQPLRQVDLPSHHGGHRRDGQRLRRDPAPAGDQPLLRRERLREDPQLRRRPVLRACQGSVDVEDADRRGHDHW